MAFLRIDHIGVAVSNVEEAAAKFENLLGLTVAAREEVEEQQLVAALIPTDDMRFELLQPTQPESVVGRFLERRGEGVHHICFEVEDIQAEIDALKGREVQLIQGAPREGFVGLVEFVHPRSAGGVLVEIAQISRRTSASTGTRLHHVTVATKDGETAASLWKTNFQLVESAREDLSDAGTRSITLGTAGGDGLGGVEFAEPSGAHGSVADFLEKSGGGVYALTLALSRAPGNLSISPDKLVGLSVFLRQQ